MQIKVQEHTHQSKEPIKVHLGVLAKLPSFMTFFPNYLVIFNITDKSIGM